MKHCPLTSSVAQIRAFGRFQGRRLPLALCSALGSVAEGRAAHSYYELTGTSMSRGTIPLKHQLLVCVCVLPSFFAGGFSSNTRLEKGCSFAGWTAVTKLELPCPGAVCTPEAPVADGAGCGLHSLLVGFLRVSGWGKDALLLDGTLWVLTLHRQQAPPLQAFLLGPGFQFCLFMKCQKVNMKDFLL
ncbi:UNVERIFIED_CONTAM: hypothetical protein K2H54_046408 [Gekko kuhli]